MNDGTYKMAFEALGAFATGMIKRKEFDISMLDQEFQQGLKRQWEGEKNAYEAVADLYNNIKERLGI